MEEERLKMDELIASYLHDGLDKSSLDELKKWMAESPENERYFMQQQEIWFSAVADEKNRYNKEKAFDDFRARVREAKANGKKVRSIPLWRYAAVAALLIAFSALSFWRGGERVKDSFAQIEVEAPIGSRTRLVLPDGTIVWLNAGSRMSYSQGFGVDDRKVKLEGEGYFEVTHNKKVPFLVTTKDLQVRVLGTKFNFRNYPTDDEALVTLEEGKVALNNLLQPGDEVMLAPNERVRLNKVDGKMQVERAVASNALQWTMGYLFFDEELLTDIMKELERSYNVKIKIATDSLKGVRFYGNFVRQEQNIQEVLGVLSSTGKIHYTIKDKNITLY